MGEGPLAAFDFILLGHANFQQVADGGRKHVVVAFIIVVLLLKPTERLGDVAGDGRFFGDYQRFSHSHFEIGNGFAESCNLWLCYRLAGKSLKLPAKSKRKPGWRAARAGARHCGLLADAELAEDRVEQI